MNERINVTVTVSYNVAELRDEYTADYVRRTGKNPDRIDDDALISAALNDAAEYYGMDRETLDMFAVVTDEEGNEL